MDGRTGGRSHGEWVSSRSERTFVDAVAEGTLEAAASVDELHVGTHVGLAPVAPDGPGLAVVH